MGLIIILFIVLYIKDFCALKFYIFVILLYHIRQSE